MENFNALLVDDEEDFTSTLAERLTMRGISTATALTGESALEIIQSDPPQVVVADMMMPGRVPMTIPTLFLKSPPLSVLNPICALYRHSQLVI